MTTTPQTRIPSPRKAPVMSTTAVATASTPGSLARRTGPSFVELTGIEIRKSLSTRSGKSVAALAVGVGPLGFLIASLTSGAGVVPAAVAIGIMGMLVALVLLALGVLSTAGEWTHKSVQTTYLLVPERGRVLAAKAAAMAWFAATQAVIAAMASGAAFAVLGAGIGAVAGNSAAALTGTYLTLLGILPVVSSVKPEIAEKLDPASSIQVLAQHRAAATPIAVIAGWVIVSTVAGVLITRRRAVA